MIRMKKMDVFFLETELLLSHVMILWGLIEEKVTHSGNGMTSLKLKGFAN